MSAEPAAASSRLDTLEGETVRTVISAVVRLEKLLRHFLGQWDANTCATNRENHAPDQRAWLCPGRRRSQSERGEEAS
jgi:hypothetical protein